MVINFIESNSRSIIEKNQLQIMKWMGGPSEWHSSCRFVSKYVILCVWVSVGLSVFGCRSVGACSSVNWCLVVCLSVCRAVCLCRYVSESTCDFAGRVSPSVLLECECVCQCVCVCVWVCVCLIKKVSYKKECIWAGLQSNTGRVFERPPCLKCEPVARRCSWCYVEMLNSI